MVSGPQKKSDETRRRKEGRSAERRRQCSSSESALGCRPWDVRSPDWRRAGQGLVQSGFGLRPRGAAFGGRSVLLNELQHERGRLVGLGEHRGTGLGERRPLRELRGLMSHINIDDPADRGFEVGPIED